MSRIRLTILLLVVVSCELAAAEAPRRRLIIIVSPSQTITDISVADLRRIYLGQITRWPNRHRIVTVILSTRSYEGQLFLKRVIQMADLDYAQHWIGEVFRGHAAAAPLVAASDVEARRFVALQPDAIAVIGDTTSMDPSVRILTVDGKSADAADYPLAW
jgi:hypothetical protein